MSCQGSYVKIVFDAADATTAAAVTLYDDQHNTVTLKPDELLLIDALVFCVRGSEETPGPVTTLFADKDGNGAVATSELLAVCNDGTHSLTYGPEGIACPTGITPKVVAGTAGDVSIVGTGRIIYNRTNTVGGTPSWKAQ